MKSKSIKPEIRTQLGELLKTEDVAIQVQRTHELIAAASAPVLNLMITFDPRVGDFLVNAVTSTGAPMDFANAHRLLDGARAKLVRSETEIRAKTVTGQNGATVQEK